ncbi:hypothetical protein AWM68_14560 [Fictibacillus phosphorivorans]|uniref:Uncharacterized protein n=1 Tax=Fictibacillus phosphorivorans TaxID=1221500 RepID=A0A165N221_9BACL|nr:hypothetical protein [Fictibacillus phosphorivorans]KZE64307.1 hypothetical protein AWM68_14560 [Fictibacillus phosphorivorans]
MGKSKWFYISLIGLSMIVMILSVMPLFMKPSIEEGSSIPRGFPRLGEMPAGGMPGAELPNNLDGFKVQQFMEEVEEKGGLTPELKQKAKEMGLPDQMLQMMGTAEQPQGLNTVSLSAMIMGTIVISFSSFRLYRLKNDNRTEKSVL